MNEATPCQIKNRTTIQTPTGMASRALNWIGRAFSEPDGTPSAKRILFGLSVVWSLGLCLGGLRRGGLTAEVVDLAEAAMYATAGGYAIARFAEPGKTDQGGGVA